MAEAKESKDWFKAIVLCAIQIERYGYKSLKEYFDSQNINPKLTEKLLKRINPKTIAEYLNVIGVITVEENKTIACLSEERNKFVHRAEGYKYLIGSKANQIYEPLIIASIRILEEKLGAVRVHATP